MSIPTYTELTLLRSHPHETNLWLSIYKPTTVLSVQLNNASAAPGDRIIPYDNVFEGWYTSVESGMTMYIGTTPGAKDVGRIRVRSATDSTITVAENSDINWEDNLFLTVVKFWEIDAIYPRITSTGTTTYWYKDYDIEYTNQNDVLGTVVCMGPHNARFLRDGTGTVYYSATGTYSLLGSDPLTYEWWFDGATVTGSSALTPGNVYYSSPGHYTTRLKVTDSNGVVDTSYRHISIYDRLEEGPNVPILDWSFISLEGSRDSGGWTARLSVRENIEDIVDGALVVIFADDWYGGVKTPIGGNAVGRNYVVFTGYILDGTINYNYVSSSVEFQVGSPTEVMKLAEGFSVAVNSSVDPSAQDADDDNIPSAWVLVKDMDCRRAIYHYLRWHSTVLMTNDFQFLGTDYAIEYFDANRSSLYDAIDGLMKGTLVGNVVCDRQGKIWAEVSIMATDGAISGSFPNTMLLDNQDWMGSPIIDEQPINEVSYIEMGGIYFDSAGGGYSGTSTAYLSAAPGEAPAYRGKVERIQGLALSSQTMLNKLNGNVFAYKNARYPDIQFNLVGNYRCFDIAPQETVKVNLQATDTPRGIVWSQKLFHPLSMSWTYNSRNGTFLPTINLHEVTQGFPATTQEIPPIPPAAGGDGGGYDVPPIFVPPIVIPGGGTIQIYHNYQWVCTVTGLNFIDDC